MRLAVFSLVAALALGSAAWAQLRVDVALIDVVATVTDERGRYVPGLTVDDFILEEDGVPQSIAHVVSSSNLPASVGIALDVSLSMQRKIETAVGAIDRFIRTIHKEDDIFLLTFAGRSSIQQDFTNDRNKLTTALRRVQLGRDTALYDGLNDTLLHVQRGIHKKRAVLLVTDGEESGASEDSYMEALANVREDQVLVYCLGIAPTVQPAFIPPPPISRPGPIILPGPRSRGGLPRGFMPPQISRGGQSLDSVNMNVLKALAAASGGEAWLVRDDREMDRILDIIANELRSQYNVDYYPTRSIRDGKWHRVELRAKDRRYTVRARKDYFGG